MLLVSRHLTNVNSVSWHIIRLVKDYISDQTRKTSNLPNLSEQGKVFLFLFCISNECFSPILHKRWWVSVCSASPNLLCNPWTMMNVLSFFWHEDGGFKALIIFLMNRNSYFGFKNWIFAPFHPLSVFLHANSTWASSGRQEWNQVETSGRPNVEASTPFWRNGRGGHWRCFWPHDLVRHAGPLETGHHLVSVSELAWHHDEKHSGFTIRLPRFLPLCVNDSRRLATATSPPSTPALQPPSLFSLLISLYIWVWSEDRRESAVGLCTVSC